MTTGLSPGMVTWQQRVTWASGDYRRRMKMRTDTPPVTTVLAWIAALNRHDPDADRVITLWPANARLAPGGREGPRERDTQVARTPLAGEAARWQLILDLLDPDKRCGAWSPATVQGRPVVCTRAPHDAREEHANAETGWRWYDETPSPHP